jgi:hypothetical protein
MPDNLQNWDLWFVGRKWRVATELTGTETEDGIAIHFDHGDFTIESPGAFQSVMGPNLGRHGVMLQEIDPQTGQDIDGALVPFGHIVADKARKEFHAIS